MNKTTEYSRETKNNRIGNSRSNLILQHLIVSKLPSIPTQEMLHATSFCEDNGFKLHGVELENTETGIHETVYLSTGKFTSGNTLISKNLALQIFTLCNDTVLILQC